MKKKKRSVIVTDDHSPRLRKNKWALALAGAGIVANIAAAIIYGVGLPEEKISEEERLRRLRLKRQEKLRRIKCPYRPYARYLLKTGKKEY